MFGRALIPAYSDYFRVDAIKGITICIGIGPFFNETA